GHGDGIVVRMPAIVIGDHGYGYVADLGLAGEFGLLQVGHADDIHTPATVEVRLRAGGEGGTFHAQVGAAVFGDDSGGGAGLLQELGELRADGIGEADVGHQAFAEEGGDAAAGAIDE